MKASVLLALAALSSAQAAESTGTLTLACEGEKAWTRSRGNWTEEKVSIGIIVDFAAQTVSSTGWPGPIPILEVTETEIVFAGPSGTSGTIDRITGSLETVAIGETETMFSLKCGPTQQVF